MKNVIQERCKIGLDSLVELYQSEKFILARRPSGSFVVALQVSWIHKNVLLASFCTSQFFFCVYCLFLLRIVIRPEICSEVYGRQHG